MTADEQRVLSRYEAFLNAWLSRDDGAKERVMAFFDTSFSGIGTARHEIWNTPEGLFEQFTKECEQLPEGGDDPPPVVVPESMLEHTSFSPDEAERSPAETAAQRPAPGGDTQARCAA